MEITVIEAVVRVTLCSLNDKNVN